MKKCAECGATSAKRWHRGYCGTCYARLLRQGKLQLQTPESRFWKFVAKTSDCWVWTGGKNRDGYGSFKIRGVYIGAHRMSWKIHFSDPGAAHVLHKCDHPFCVNPAHLFLGDHKANMRDRTQKGRWGGPHGALCHTAKLTPEQVKEARRLYAIGGYRYVDLARIYGVTKSTMGSLLRRESWARVS